MLVARHMPARRRTVLLKDDDADGVMTVNFPDMWLIYRELADGCISQPLIAYIEPVPENMGVRTRAASICYGTRGGDVLTGQLDPVEAFWMTRDDWDMWLFYQSGSASNAALGELRHFFGAAADQVDIR